MDALHILLFHSIIFLVQQAKFLQLVAEKRKPQHMCMHTQPRSREPPADAATGRMCLLLISVPPSPSLCCRMVVCLLFFVIFFSFHVILCLNASTDCGD